MKENTEEIKNAAKSNTESPNDESHYDEQLDNLMNDWTQDTMK